MIRTIVALVGCAVLGAILAGFYYAPGNTQSREEGAPAYHLAPGDVKSTQIQATVADTPVIVTLRIVGPPIDVYVLERDWAQSLPDRGLLNLSQPFSFRSEWSLLNVTGDQTIVLLADGKTAHNLVFDHSDNHYEGDAVPLGGDVVSIQMTTRYEEEESRSLMLGYIAATPSVLLVAVTLARKARRHWGRREESGKAGGQP